jgi:hypothetical protein
MTIYEWLGTNNIIGRQRWSKVGTFLECTFWPKTSSIGKLEQLTTIVPTQTYVFDTKVVNWIGCVNTNAFTQVHFA